MAQYVTLQEAEDYFETRLHSGKWGTYPPGDRNAALITASRVIDRLNFAGEKAPAYAYRCGLNKKLYSATDELAIKAAGATQELQFPRGSDTAIPANVKVACCEEAFDLLMGKDAGIEYENMRTVSQGFSSVRKTNDPSFYPDHLRNGIVSSQAWMYLLPFLRDRDDFKISRV